MILTEDWDTYLGFDLVVEKLFLEVMQSVVSTVIVQIQRIENVSANRQLPVSTDSKVA